MKDAGFFVGFFAVIVLLALVTSGSSGSASKTATSTVHSSKNTVSEDTRDELQNETYTPPPTPRTPEPVYEAPRPPAPPPLTPAQVEDRVAYIYRDLDRLREDVRLLTISSPESPYANKVTLSTGNVYSEDPDTEYLMLRVGGNGTSSVNISSWYLRSYVTGEVALIPDGDRVLENYRNLGDDPIVLSPGESAYLVTGDSPLDGSFKENMCTGYLTTLYDFYPSIGRSCPYPRDELKRFGTGIDLDDDECYDFIGSLSSCTTPDDELYTARKVGSACSRFVDTTFNYRDCVRLHRYDPYFTRENGYWHIYLEERSELWRPRREIIQLMDENDRVVDVIEY